jgi:hexosaminidase
MRHLILSLFLTFATSVAVHAQPAPQVNLMPMPSKVVTATGQLPINQQFTFALAGHHEPRLERAKQRFLKQLNTRTGMPMHPDPSDHAKATLLVKVEHASSSVQDVTDDESYKLEITPQQALLSAPTPLGTMHGLETFLQLLTIGPSGFFVPAMSIEDAPRFPWRGLLIDVSRHFIPLDVLKRNLDGMAAVKMNVLHWHLSDNEGFRVESKRLPKLHEMGSEGLYYTQQEIHDFIEYARDRGIRVVPEFDIPGHSRSWLVGYPEIASGPGPYRVERRDDSQDPIIDPTQDRTYKFLDTFVGEMARLFPDAYFHIGGDEVNGKQWDANPKIQEFIRAHNMKNNADLQAYFNHKLQQIVEKHGKVMVGWDEILRPDLPKSVVVQSWRGQQSLAAAARDGYRGILSYGYYLDLMWPAARHYAIEPMSGDAAGLTPEEKKRILGGEACMWSEFVNPENIDSRVWPRAAVVAERLWSQQDVTDVSSMYERMNRLSGQLEALGLTHRSNYRAALERMSGGADSRQLKALGSVVEPVKDYTRMDTSTVIVNASTPLNRLVDAVAPESATARDFSNLVDAYAQSKFTDSRAAAQIRSQLEEWRNVDPQLEPILGQSYLTKELSPISQNLSALAVVALQALDYLQYGSHPAAGWAESQATLIASSQKAHGDLLLMIVSPIERLMIAAAGQPASSP